MVLSADRPVHHFWLVRNHRHLRDRQTRIGTRSMVMERRSGAQPYRQIFELHTDSLDLNISSFLPIMLA